VKLAQKDCDIVVCSVFINPTQFNDSNDLENYPITVEEDIKLLEEQSCDILFLPNVSEMYPEGLKTNQYLLNGIDKVLEGRKRPGHFDGVCTIVHRLFSIVKPNTAYFGEKDFQQVAVIRQMVNSLSLPIQINTGKTIREKDGLAKSSRNILLSTTQRKKATRIYVSLQKTKSLYGNVDCNQLKEIIKDDVNQVKDMRLDYIEIVNPHSFKPLQGKGTNEEAVALMAVFLGKVRLIDNLSLND
jgi:pantoate--beta-alanine ligase